MFIQRGSRRNKNIASIIIVCAVILFMLASCSDIFGGGSSRERAGGSNRSSDTGAASSPGGSGNSGLVLHHDDFINAAKKAGYTIIIEDDYDGFNTYWAGAHKFAPGEVEKEGNEIYVIDYTRDATIHNAKVEFILYVDKVKEIGGVSVTGSGDDYEYQANSSDTRFGVAYRIGDINMYVVADAEYKNEILAFLKAMDFGIEI